MQALRQKLSEVPRLRRELADTKAALAEMEEALSWDTHRVADKYIMGGGAAGGAPAEFAGASPLPKLGYSARPKLCTPARMFRWCTLQASNGGCKLAAWQILMRRQQFMVEDVGELRS